MKKILSGLVLLTYSGLAFPGEGVEFHVFGEKVIFPSYCYIVVTPSILSSTIDFHCSNHKPFASFVGKFEKRGHIDYEESFQAKEYKYGKDVDKNNLIHYFHQQKFEEVKVDPVLYTYILCGSDVCMYIGYREDSIEAVKGILSQLSELNLHKK